MSQELAPLPTFELSNKTVVDELIEKAGDYPQITEENLSDADAFLKGGKQILKIASDERLNFTRRLDDIKKQAMGPEKAVEAALAPIEKRILDVKREIHNREEAKRQEAERIERERVQREQAEIARKQTHQNNLITFRSGLESQLRNATLETVDTVERSIRAQNVSADKWEEFAGQAKAIVDEVKLLFPSNRRDLQIAADADAKVAAELADRRAQEEKERQERERQERERVSSEAFTSTMEVTRQADANVQAAAAQKVSGVRTVRKFEVIDLASVPAAYLMLDEKKVREAVTAGIPSIPGIRIYNDIASTGR